MEPLLTIQNLHVQFSTSQGTGRVVNGLTFHVQPHETLALVGESGCGKSVTSLSILRLLPSPPAEIVSGSLFFQGQNLLQLHQNEMRKIRGNAISMIFQEPMSALNPVFRVGHQIGEVFQIHRGATRKEAFDLAVEMMRKVQIPAADQRAKEYPHQLSGGMRQRIMIAMALACEPELLIADEPTTALDVTVQAQILSLMNGLQQRTGASILLITHDLGLVAQTADRVAVMYAGQIVETAHVEKVFSDPLHPYTQGLLRSIPRLHQKTQTKLNMIPGNVPSPFQFPHGCPFHPRCEKRFELCSQHAPPNICLSDEREVRCFLYQE